MAVSEARFSPLACRDPSAADQMLFDTKSQAGLVHSTNAYRVAQYRRLPCTLGDMASPLPVCRGSAVRIPRQRGPNLEKNYEHPARYPDSILPPTMLLIGTDHPSAEH